MFRGALDSATRYCRQSGTTAADPLARESGGGQSGLGGSLIQPVAKPEYDCSQIWSSLEEKVIGGTIYQEPRPSKDRIFDQTFARRVSRAWFVDKPVQLFLREKFDLTSTAPPSEFRG